MYGNGIDFNIFRNNMEARAEHLKTRNYNSLFCVTTAFGVGVLIMMLSWLTRFRGGFSGSSDIKQEFNWHPLCMVTGMIFLYGQSILVYRTGRNAPKKRLKIIHAIVNSTAFALAVLGLKAVFDSHNLAQPPIPNLYTMHSWLGLTAVVVFSGQLLTGFVTFLYPSLSKTIRQTLMPVHRAMGVATFVLSIVAALTGLTEKTIWTLSDAYKQLPSEGILLNFIALFITVFGMFVLYLVNDADFKRQSLPEDEVALTTTN